MSARTLCLILGVAALGLVAGCGGGSGGPGPDPGGATISVGTLRVTVASAATFHTLPLMAGTGGEVSFTAMWGSTITALQDVGVGDIAFSSSRTGGGDIYLMNPDATNARRLTNDAANDYQPRFTQDGARIVFTTSRDGSPEVYTMNADGSNEVSRSSHAAADQDPAWSPDGDWIVWSSARDGNYNVYKMRDSGNNKTGLTSDSEPDIEPAWSPDGHKIAFASSRGPSDYEIYLMNTDGTSQTAITTDPANDFGPAWSPDGMKLAFWSQRDGQNEVYTMYADGSLQQRITNDAGDDREPSWSPDGRWIYFTSNRDGKWQTYRTAASGGAVYPVSANGFDERDPCWSPGPVVRRQLIGPAGSDGGENPPFGASRGLAIVGLTREALVNAVTITTSAANWPTVEVEAMPELGPQLVGAKVTAAAISKVLEDIGRGLPTREWLLTKSPATGGVLVFFRLDTGRVASVIGVADTATDAVTSVSGGHVVLNGAFVDVLTTDGEATRVVAGSARRVELSARTGEVMATE